MGLGPSSCLVTSQADGGVCVSQLVRCGRWPGAARAVLLQPVLSGNVGGAGGTDLAQLQRTARGDGALRGMTGYPRRGSSSTGA